MSDPIVKRGGMRTVIGIEVSSIDVKLYGGSDTTVANTPLPAFALQGGFDGAMLEVRRFFAESWENAPVGNLSMFAGRVGDVEITGTEVGLTVNSLVELLNVQMPRNIYMASCAHTLYDSGCTLSAAAFTVSSSAAADSTRALITSGLGNTDGYFDLGTIIFTSGLNTGVKRTVKRYTADGNVALGFPLPYLPEAGDAFDIKPGCDKTSATCTTKFSNLDNFRGFEFIPVPESTL